ncbi:hypothetical protein KPP03845_104434 [Streptomyces xanthophaeus]|nr:hypothetical protein KPP03845_104434 [Streptomyces xanthophaeus]
MGGPTVQNVVDPLDLIATDVGWVLGNHASKEVQFSDQPGQ